MQKRDIEQLVVWAFEETARRELMVIEGGGNILHGIMSGIPSGSGIIGARAQRYAGVIPPHPDAIAIERAVLALPDVVIDWPASRATLLGDLDGWFDAWIDWQGCRLRQVGLRQIIDDLTVRTDPLLPMQTAEIVRRVAVLGRRPGGATARPECAPHVINGRSPMIIHIERGRRLVSPQRVASRILAQDRHYCTAEEQCPVVWSPTPIEIAQARAQWAAWHSGLVRLCDQLDGQLRAFVPTGPAAPAEPWRGEVIELPRRVLPARREVIPAKPMRRRRR